MTEIILASTSDYRKQQLSKLKIQFAVMGPDVDEEHLKAQVSSGEELSKELALRKATAISNQFKDAIVIGGDQVALYNQTILNKPITKPKAFDQLRSLSGSSHCLITSLAIVYQNQKHLRTCIAKLKMRELSDAWIRIVSAKPLSELKQDIPLKRSIA